ncbi:phage/plasmid primase, P4 family [Streptomyces sp. NPDC057686]|uniref:DNA primase family protein n=1 Tax=Streptomyces sp. NPDC057686 TaxID=3346212 RepID=UPI0036B04FAB
MSTTSRSFVEKRRTLQSYSATASARALVGVEDGSDFGSAEVLLPSSLTDWGMANLFLRVFGDEYRFVPEHGWYKWGGHRWQMDAKAKSITNSVFQLAEQMPCPDPRDNLSIRFSDRDLDRHRKKSLSIAGVRALIATAESLPDLMLDATELDADPYALCTPSGIVNLRTGGLLEPSRDHTHTRSTTVGPRRMPTPIWDKFLIDTFGDDDEGRSIIAYLQRLCGYSISGDVDAQIMPFLFGEGQNGKSVLVSVLLSILGDYADTAPPNFLMAPLYPDHPTEMADLQGRRLVFCSEIDPGAKFDEAKLKLLTGGDQIKARRMRQDFFTFRPTHKPWLIGNHRPTVETGGYSFWRRMRIIMFARTVRDQDVVENLAAKMISREGPGILQWLINGAVAYFDGTDRKLVGPDSVRLATQDYEESEDSVGQFVRESCVMGPHNTHRAEQAQLRRAYEAWCAAAGMRPVPVREFGNAIRRLARMKGPKDMVKSNGRRHYVGIGLAEEGRDESATAGARQ